MAPLIVDDEMSRLGMGHAHEEGSSFWAPSLDPRNEDRMPSELKTWRRWSNQFDKEQEFDFLRFDMNTLCSNCSSSTWELIDHPEIKAIQCRTCGNIPSETRSPRTSTLMPRFSTRCSRNLPRTYSEDDEAGESSSASSFRTRSDSKGSTFSSSSTADMGSQDHISERDFASPKPRHLSSHGNSGIRSVRQSMIQPTPKPRWFEQKQTMTFQFKLTPRGRTGASPAAKVPLANIDGSTTEPAQSDSGAAESSSKPPGSTAAESTRNIPISQLSNDPTAWQRLLTTALFLMKEDHLPKPGQSKVLDLGLATSRNSGGKHLAMKHHSGGEHEKIMQSEQEEAKRVLWKVVVRPVGGAPAKARGGDGSLLPR